MTQVQLPAIKLEIIGKTAHSKEEILKGELDKIQEETKRESKALEEKAKRNYYKSKLNIYIGMWKCGQALASYFTPLDSEPSWAQLSRDVGYGDKTLKKWYETYSTYPDYQVFIEKLAMPRAESWAEKVFQRVEDEEELDDLDRFVKEITTPKKELFTSDSETSIEDICLVGQAISNKYYQGDIAGVYWHKDEAYALSCGNTMILRFENVFPYQDNEINFDPLDYELGDTIKKDKDGGVLFEHEIEGWVKTVHTRSLRLSFFAIKEVFEKVNQKRKGDKYFEFQKSISGLLDERLSHTEFYLNGDQFELLQRDIYRGRLITILRKGGEIEREKAIRKAVGTVPFLSLFFISDEVLFDFSPEEFIYFKGKNMEGIISGGIFDECYKAPKIQF